MYCKKCIDRSVLRSLAGPSECTETQRDIGARQAAIDKDASQRLVGFYQQDNLHNARNDHEHAR